MSTTTANGKLSTEKTVHVDGQMAEKLRALGLNVTDPGDIKFIVKQHENPAIVLHPETMNLLEVANQLVGIHEDNESEQRYIKTFSSRHYKETLVAITRCLNRVLGRVHGVTQQGFFSNKPPIMLDIVTGIKDGIETIEKAFEGKFIIDPFDKAEALIKVSGMNDVSIIVDSKKKFGKYIDGLFLEIERELKENSFYKGKSLIVEGGQHGADFRIVELKEQRGIFLNEEEEAVVQDFILDELKSVGKRTYLFTGNYGNGKTETALRVGIEANRVGMTFFYLKDPALFTKMLETAHLYGACALFVEDIDEVTSGEERDNDMNEILNTLDGLETKGRTFRVILTTNHIERINAAARRPGRIDIIRKFNNPTELTKVKILKHYFQHLSGFEELNLEIMAQQIGDVTGATVAEICKRAVILAGKKGGISEQVFMSAFASIEYQIEVMKGKAEMPPVTTVDEIFRLMLEPLRNDISLIKKDMGIDDCSVC